MLWDVIIVGGGPAGLTAGLYSSRARLKSLLVEKAFPGGQVTTTEWIENYPGFEEPVSGIELSQRMEKQAKKFGLEIVQGSVKKVSIDGKIKKVLFENGETYSSKSIILCTGANPKPLNIDGEEKFRGRGVSYCAVCDGAFFKGKRLAVIGGGNSAVEEALFLTKFAEIVYIIHRRDQLRAERVLQERVFSHPKIKLIWNSVPEKIDGEDTVNALFLKNVKTGESARLDVGGVFVYIGHNPNTELLKDIVALNANNYIITDDAMATSQPGIFAAGDVRQKSLKQIATAVGDGATAAYSAEKYIEENFR